MNGLFKETRALTVGFDNLNVQSASRIANHKARIYRLEKRRVQNDGQARRKSMHWY